MTVGELIEILEALPEDMPVAVGQQPNYPLKAELHGVAKADGEVFILASQADGYLDSELWDQTL